MRPRRNAPSTLENAAAHVRRGMETTRRGRESLPELRERERNLLREWAGSQDCLFREDPTLTLERRSSHGEHVVGFDPNNSIWWKTTHPGKAGVGAEFVYEMLPPFSVTGIFARELPIPGIFSIPRLLRFRWTASSSKSLRRPSTSGFWNTLPADFFPKDQQKLGISVSESNSTASRFPDPNLILKSSA